MAFEDDPYADIMAPLRAGPPSTPGAPAAPRIDASDPYADIMSDLRQPQAPPAPGPFGSVGNALETITYPLGIGKRAVDAAARKVANLEGIPTTEGETTGQMLRAAATGAWEADRPNDYAPRLLGRLTEFGGDIASDPLTHLLGGVGDIAGAGKVAQAALGAGDFLVPEAAQAAEAAAAAGRTAEKVGRVASAAFAPSMATGAYNDITGAIRKYRDAGGMTPEVADLALGGGLSAAMGYGTADHALDGRISRALSIGHAVPVDTRTTIEEPAPRPAILDELAPLEEASPETLPDPGLGYTRGGRPARGPLEPTPTIDAPVDLGQDPLFEAARQQQAEQQLESLDALAAQGLPSDRGLTIESLAAQMQAEREAAARVEFDAKAQADAAAEKARQEGIQYGAKIMGDIARKAVEPLIQEPGRVGSTGPIVMPEDAGRTPVDLAELRRVPIEQQFSKAQGPTDLSILDKLAGDPPIEDRLRALRDSVPHADMPDKVDPLNPDMPRVWKPEEVDLGLPGVRNALANAPKTIKRGVRAEGFAGPGSGEVVGVDAVASIKPILGLQDVAAPPKEIVRAIDEDHGNPLYREVVDKLAAHVDEQKFAQEQRQPSDGFNPDNDQRSDSVVDRRADVPAPVDFERRLAERREIAQEVGLDPENPEHSRALDTVAQERARAKAAEYERDIDPQTGVGSRGAYDRAIKAHAATGTKPGAVSEVDVAGAGATNKRFGEPYTDAILQATGRALQHVVGPHGNVFRKGGDEFVIHWHDPKTGAEMHAAVPQALADAEIIVEHDGRTVAQWRGVDHYDGFGPDFKSASDALYAKKPRDGDPAYKQLPSTLAGRIEAGRVYGEGDPSVGAGPRGGQGGEGEGGAGAPPAPTPVADGRHDYARIEEERARAVQEGEDELRNLGRVPVRATGVRGQLPAGSGARTLGLGIKQALERRKWVDLRGRTVLGSQDVAVLGQVFRNPALETFRIIYTKGETVVGHEGMTSRMPGFVAVLANEPSAKARQILEIRSRMQRLDADGYYLLHNHPSGRPLPSPEDVQATAEFDRRIPGLKGHVVIDHTEYGSIGRDRDGRWVPTMADLPEGARAATDELLTPSLPHLLLGRKVGGPEVIADMGRTLASGNDSVTLFHLASDGKVRAIQDAPVNLFVRGKEFADFALGQARAFGGRSLVAYFDGSRPAAIVEAARQHFASGTLLDLVTPSEAAGINATSMRRPSENALFGRDAGSFMKTHRVNEADESQLPAPRYRIDPSPGSLRESEQANPLRDQRTADTKLFGDPRVAEAIRVKGFQSLSIQRQREVLARMVRATHDPEVLRRIVEAVPVDVMDDLVGTKLSADDLLHDPSVIAGLLSVPHGEPIVAAHGRFVDDVAAGTNLKGRLSAPRAVEGASATNAGRLAEHRLAADLTGNALLARPGGGEAGLPAEGPLGVGSGAGRERLRALDAGAGNHPIDAPSSTSGVGPVSVDVIRKELGSRFDVRDHGNGEASILAPNGRRIALRLGVDGIDYNAAAFREGYGREMAPDEQIIGAWQRVDRDGMIWLAKGAEVGTFKHEWLHAAMELVLTPKEKAAVLERYKDEETAAEAYAKWDPAQPTNSLFARIHAFFRRIYNAWKPSAESVFEKVKSGEAFGRETGGEFGTPHPETERKFSSTQVDLPESIGRRMQALASEIPERDLSTDPNGAGRERDPHVTVKFGLHTNDADAVRAALAGEGPIKVRLGDTSVFPAKKGADYDVVKLDVDSPDLHRLNEKIASAIPATDTHPTYQPHATLAYVKPGLGEKYAGNSTLRGTEATIHDLTLSTRDGNEIKIPLGGSAKSGEATATQATAPKYATAPAQPPDVTAAKARMAGKPEAPAEEKPLGRLMEPDEAHRVDTKVENVREADPAAELKRDERETWKSLDPKVKKRVRELSDPKEEERLHKRISDGKTVDAVDVQAMDAMSAGKKAALDEVRRKLAKAQAEGRDTGPDNVAFLRASFDVAINDYAKSVGKEVDAGTLLGRAMAARARVMSAMGKSAPDQFLREVFKQIDGVSNAQAADLFRLFNERPQDLSDALRAAIKPKTLNKWLEAWKNGLVSAPGTQVANVLGNAGEQVVRVGETAVGMLVDKLMPGPKTRASGEAAWEMRGQINGLLRGIGQFKSDIHDIIHLAPEKIDIKSEFEHQAGSIGSGTIKGHQVTPFHLGRAVRAPFRLLGAFDNLFKSIGSEAEMYKLALRHAKGDVAEAARLVARDADGVPAASSEIMQAVAKSTAERVFQSPNELVSMLDRLRSRYPILHGAMPFLKTPANIARLTIERSPLGLLGARKAYGAYREAVARGADQATVARLKGEAVDKLARPLVGTMIMGAFGVLAKAGGMTGSGPTDPKDRNALRSSGWQPYSFVVTVDGKKRYVPFNRFEPVSSLLGFTADMVELGDSKTAGDLFDKGLGSFAQNLLSKSYLQGLADAAEAINDPKRFASRYVTNFAGSAIPNVIAKGAQALDPVLRDTKGETNDIKGAGQSIIRTIESRIPGLSQSLPARKDGSGETITRPGNAVTRLLSPIQPSEDKDNAAFTRKLVELDAVPSPPQKTLSVKGHKIPLSDEELEKIHEADRRATDEVERLVSSSSFQRLPEETQRQVIESAYSRARGRARNAIIDTASFRRRAREMRAI